MTGTGGISGGVKRKCILLCALFIVIYITPLMTHPLLEPDEGRYAEIPREMIESGDYITPKLNYVRYFEKPVLLYWMNAISFRLLGENAFAARLPSALLALAGIAVTGVLAASMFGKRAGYLAAVITGTSPLYLGVGTINLTDMPVSFFITLGMAAFYAGQRNGERRAYLIFYAAIAFGLLTKGLIAIIFPAGIIFLFSAVTRKWRLLKDILYLPGILLFFVISVPWFYLVCRENPDFFNFFFIQEHFLRYTTRMHDRYEPVWFFLPILAAGFLPWAAFLFSLPGRGSTLRAPDSGVMKEANIFLLLWGGVIFLFFSASNSKLIPYIVPCIPPFAIMISANIDRCVRGNTGRLIILCNMGVNLLFSLALLAYALTGIELSRKEGLISASIISVGLVAGALLALPFARREKSNSGRAITGLIAGSLIFALGLQSLYVPVGRVKSIAPAAEVVNSRALPGQKIAVYGEILQAMPFYTKRRVVLVDALGELAFGAASDELGDWFIDGRTFLQKWDAGESYLLVVEKGRETELFGKDVRSVKLRLESGNYMILSNKEADK